MPNHARMADKPGRNKPGRNGGVPIAMGVGCRRDCPPEALMALAADTLAHAGLTPNQITLIATLSGRQHEMAIASLTRAWHCPLIDLSKEALQASESTMSHVSDAAWRTHGVPGVAEAAALAAIRQHCDEPARLLVSRQQCPQATCALAVPSAIPVITE